MTDKADLSPEEKLLKVIQDGDEKGEPADEQGAELRSEHANAVAAAGGDSARARLKLADQPQAAREFPPAADAEDSSAVQLMDAVEDLNEPAMSVVAPGKKVAGGGFVISTVNKILAAVIVIMLGFAVYEVWASVTTRPLSRETMVAQPAEGGADAAGVGEPNVLPGGPGSEWDIEKTLAAFRKRPILGAQDEVGVLTGPTVPPPPPQVGWVQVARESLNLIGLSEVTGGSGEVEAIVVDRAADKMFFLTVGAKFIVGNSKEVTVENITTEGVELSDGQDKITVK